jgi:hypothetical protein
MVKTNLELSYGCFRLANTGAHGFIDHAKEFTDIERLCKITASAGRHEALDLAGRRVRADHYHRDVARDFILPQARQNFVPAQIGQMKVE